MTLDDAREIAEDLPPPLRQGILDAAAARARGEAQGKLHQMIVGPFSSGKTTLAHDYALALAEAGLAQDGKIVEIRYHEQLDFDDVERRFDDARGGVIIIDDITRHVDDASLPVPLTSFMWRALAGTETTVILTGYKEKMEDFAATAPDDKRALLPRPVTLEKSYSFDERQSFVNPNDAAREKRAARRRIAEAWKDAKNVAATVKPVVAPKTARFRQKNGLDD